MSRPGPSPYYQYWGKTDRTDDEDTRCHLLAYHSLDVAAVGRRVLERDPLLRGRLAALVGLPENDLVPIVTFFLALHDLGKFSDRFQGLAPRVMQRLSGRDGGRAYRPTMHHSTMGYALWEEIWPGIVAGSGSGAPDADSRRWRRRWRPWFSASTGHHGVPPDGDTVIDDLFYPGDRETVSAFVGELCKVLLPGDGLPGGDALPSAETMNASSWFLAGLAVLADWLGSSDDIAFREEIMPLATYWNTIALRQADTVLDRADLLPVRLCRARGLAGLMDGFVEPTPLQRYLEECEIGPDPELFILEDATGSGKTEAALLLAHRLMEAGHGEGLFMGLPTMATANAMYGRLGDVYTRFFDDTRSPSLLVTHGRRRFVRAPLAAVTVNPAVAIEASPPEERRAAVTCSAWLTENRKRALLAHVGVGTIDQALMAVLPIRHQSLRLLGLSRSVLIVDEVHAYDPYVHTLLNALLYFHASFGGSAILLSATLPAHQRQKLVESYRTGRGLTEPVAVSEQAPYPLVTRSGDKIPDEIAIGTRPLCRREVQVEFVHSTDAVLGVIGDAVRAGECVCWIRNTVGDAMEAYRLVTERFGAERTRLFHARYADGDRFEREAEVVGLFGVKGTAAERAGQRLIATQVVEQSLDLDFDCMISDLAPIDLLLQRAGRLHQHERPHRRGTPRLVVLSPPLDTPPDEDWYSRLFRGGSYVYPRHGQLWLTATLLETAGGFEIPGDARELIEGVYGEKAQARIPEPLIMTEVRATGRDSADRTVALLTALAPESGYLRGPEGSWPEEERARTRLGEPTVDLTLARWNGTELLPWCDGDDGWELSRIAVPVRIVSGEHPRDAALAAAVEVLQRRSPHLGRTTLLIPLRPGDGGVWSADAEGPGEKQIRILYDATLGLRVE